jgi:hypothetical protein
MLGNIFNELALQKHSEDLQGHPIKDYIYMAIFFPPKNLVTQVVDKINAICAIHVDRKCGSHCCNYDNHNSLGRAYYV